MNKNNTNSCEKVPVLQLRGLNTYFCRVLHVARQGSWEPCSHWDLQTRAVLQVPLEIALEAVGQTGTDRC